MSKRKIKEEYIEVTREQTRYKSDPCPWFVETDGKRAGISGGHCPEESGVSMPIPQMRLIALVLLLVTGGKPTSEEIEQAKSIVK